MLEIYDEYLSPSREGAGKPLDDDERSLFIPEEGEEDIVQVARQLPLQIERVFEVVADVFVRVTNERLIENTQAALKDARQAIFEGPHATSNPKSYLRSTPPFENL